MKLTAETVTAGYELLFDPLTRAAHRACLEHAAVTQPDGWPTIRDCLAFAQFYGVEVAPFAAFFGYLSWAVGKQTRWVIVTIALIKGAFSNLADRNAGLPMPDHIKEVIDAARNIVGGPGQS